MPTANVNDATLHYRFDGPEDGPVILVSNSLASNLSMWDHQIDTLTGLGFPGAALRQPRPRAVRGHPGPYGIEMLAEDAVGLLDALGIERASFMGCSKGGMVGQMAGTKHGDRFDKLVLCSTSAYMGRRGRLGGPHRGGGRRRDGRGGGRDDRPLVHRAGAGAAPRRRGPGPGDDPRDPAGGVHRLRPCDRGDGPAREHPRDRPADAGVVGEHDPGTPPSAAELIHDRIAGSKLVVLEDSAHFCNIEQAGAFNAALEEFLGA